MKDADGVEQQRCVQRTTPIAVALEQIDRLVDQERLDLVEFVCQFTHDLWRRFNDIAIAALRYRRADVAQLFVTSLADVEWSYLCTQYRKDDEERERKRFMHRRWQAMLAELFSRDDDGSVMFVQQAMAQLSPPFSALQSLSKSRSGGASYRHGSAHVSPLDGLLQSYLEQSLYDETICCDDDENNNFDQVAYEEGGNYVDNADFDSCSREQYE